MCGVVLCTLVAWACALWSDLGTSSAATYRLEGGSWAVVDYRQGFGAARICGYGMVPEQPSDRPVIARPCWSRSTAWITKRHREDHIWFEDGRGWPFISMWWTFRFDRGQPRGPWYVDPSDPVVVLRQHKNGPINSIRAIPIVPRWPGFAADSVIWALAVWIAVRAARVARRWARRARHRCPACGYDLRGGGERQCPECGWTRGGLSV